MMPAAGWPSDRTRRPRITTRLLASQKCGLEDTFNASRGRFVGRFSRIRTSHPEVAKSVVSCGQSLSSCLWGKRACGPSSVWFFKNPSSKFVWSVRCFYFEGATRMTLWRPSSMNPNRKERLQREFCLRAELSLWASFCVRVRCSFGCLPHTCQPTLSVQPLGNTLFKCHPTPSLSRKHARSRSV